jgi:hypothetical protein
VKKGFANEGESMALVVYFGDGGVCTCMHFNAQVSIITEVSERLRMKHTLIGDDVRLI